MTGSTIESSVSDRGLDKHNIMLYTCNMKRRTSHTLSEECKRLLRLLSERFGLSQASVIEFLVREKARQEGLEGREEAHESFTI